MRLGDLDALKEDLGKSTVTIIGYGKAVFLDKAYEIIDNAQPVFDCRSCKNNGNERECVDCHDDHSNYVRYEKRPQVDLISPLTELCGEYCKNCPVTDENECTDCLITHIRGIIGGKE